MTRTKRNRKLFRWISALVGIVLVLGVLAGIWVASQQRLAKDLAAADRLSDIQQMELTLQEGPAPTDWPLRAFVPREVFGDLVSALVGAEIVFPMGQADAGHVDGYIHVTIEDAHATTADAALAITVAAKATYEPDRVTPNWSSATVDLVIKAILLPIGQKKNDKKQVTEFRVVPDSIGLGIGTSLISLKSRAFFSSLIADEAVLHWGDKLTLPMPSMTAALKMDASIDSTSYQAFGGEGGTTLATTMRRAETVHSLAMDKWVVTKSGLWLLGGKPSKPAPSSTVDGTYAEKQLPERERALITLLAPFQTNSDEIQVVVPSSELIAFINDTLTPTPLSIDVVTKDTTGLISKAYIIKNDSVLGNVGLDIRPRGDSFGRGSISIAPGTPAWNGQTGLTLPVSLSATASADVDLHLSPGIGANLDAPVTLLAAATTSSRLNAKFEKVTLGKQDALVLESEAACAPVSLRTTLSPVPAFNTAWMQFSPIGLQMDTALGTSLAPSIIVGPTPLIVKLPFPKDARGVAITHDPERQLVLYKHPFLALWFKSGGADMTDSSVALHAGVTVASRDSDLTDSEREQRSDFKRQLSNAHAKLDCGKAKRLFVTGGEAKILNLTAEFDFIKDSLKRKIEISRDAWNALVERNPGKLPADMLAIDKALQKDATATVHHAYETVTKAINNGNGSTPIHHVCQRLGVVYPC